MPPGQEYQRTSEDYLRQAGREFGSLGRRGAGLSEYGQALGSRQRRVYEPLNERLVRTAELDPNDLVDQAAIDTTQAFDKARGIEERRLSRMGVDPSSGRFRGLQQQLSLAQAAAEAGARTRARRSGRRESFGRMIQAAGIGQQLPGLAISARQAGASIGAGAGRDFRALANDYGSLAAGEAEADLLRNNSFQDEISSLFGGGMPQGGLTSGYNQSGYGTFTRGLRSAGGGSSGSAPLSPTDKSSFFSRKNDFFARGNPFFERAANRE